MTVLNTDDFMRELEECISLEGDMNLPDELLESRPALLEKLNRLTNYKLTVEELNDSLIFLMNLMYGNQPRLAFQILPDDKIRMPFAMLDKILPTKGKLTKEEKLVYAYCVNVACSSINVGAKEKMSGVHFLINRPDNLILEDLRFNLKMFPKYYAFLNQYEQNDPGSFGITRENPIRAVSINAAYKYLQQLRTRSNEPVMFERLGSLSGINGNIIDGYTLSYNEDGLTKTLDVYIDPYSNDNSNEAPRGLILCGNSEIIEIQKLAEQGIPEAQFELAVRLANGESGLIEDYHAAFKWYMRAARQGVLAAVNNIGLMYSKGLGLKQNYKEAARFYKIAADEGFADALHNLGCLYEQGNGVEKSITQAMKFWKMAAEKGKANSNFNLGLQYFTGQNVKKDYKEAAKWFTRASELGDMQSTYNLALLYETGSGVTRDRQKALELYFRAASMNSELALRAVKRMLAHEYIDSLN